MENPMRPMRLFPLLLLAMPLAACNGPSSSISIDAKTDADGNSTVLVDNGTVSIKGEGFQGSFRMPKINIDAEDFDINGMKLYPGSTIHDFHLDAKDRPGDDNDKGNVSVRFESPAPLAKVQAWFRDGMTKRGFKFSQKGDGFTGTTAKGETFDIDLSGDGADKAKGKIEVSGGN
jgi:hypothetical protein